MVRCSHIVVAEDETGTRNLIAFTIGLAFPTALVSAVADGVRAFELLSQTAASVLVTDHTMPGLTGIELAQTLRAHGATLPIVMISAEPAIAQAAHAAGVTHFLEKPFVPEGLVALLAPLLAAQAGAGAAPAAP